MNGENQIRCESACQALCDQTKSISIVKLPRVVVLQLKRFGYDQKKKKSSKINDPVTFEREQTIGGKRYALQAIIVHSGGESIESGHYTAWVRIGDAETSWYEFNDATVSGPFSFTELQAQQAYMLFYEHVGSAADELMDMMDVDQADTSTAFGNNEAAMPAAAPAAKKPATLDTIGGGVEVTASKIAGAGKGLFAKGRCFAARAEITEYSGVLLTLGGKRNGGYRCEPLKYEAAGRDVQTHIARVQPEIGNAIYVDGDREPTNGRGGGSFANHSASPNAKLVARDGRIVLVALREPIEDGDEITIYYGEGKDVAMGTHRWVQTTDVDGKPTVEKRELPPSFHQTGVRLLKNAIPVDSGIADKIRESNYDTDGLPNGPDPNQAAHAKDHKRMQTQSHNPSWCDRLAGQQTEVLRKEGLLKTSDGKEKKVQKMRALKSLPTDRYDVGKTEPQEGDQDGHTDEPVAKLQQMDDEDKPLATIYAIQHGSRLRIRPLGGEWTIVTLEPGDLLVFRGDVCHNGMGYAEENYRVHSYVYPPGYTSASSLHGGC
jgi:hypothetical protein